MSSYTPDWREGLIQRVVRERAGHQCEECGMAFKRGTNLAVTAKNKLGRPMVGTVHHINHDKTDNSPSNLVFLCQSCHWKLHIYDWRPGEFLPPHWVDHPPGWVTQRGIPYQRTGQLALPLDGGE